MLDVSVITKKALYIKWFTQLLSWVLVKYKDENVFLNKNMSSRKAGLRQFGLQYNYGFNNQSTGRKQSVETLQGT